KKFPQPGVCTALEKALELRPGALHRMSRYGGSFSLDRKRIWNEIDRACRAAGIRHFSPHDFRRAWGTRMYAAGFGIERVSKWMGHSDVEVTKRYLGVTDDYRPTGAEIRDRMNTLRAPGAAPARRRRNLSSI